MTGGARAGSCHGVAVPSAYLGLVVGRPAPEWGVADVDIPQRSQLTTAAERVGDCVWVGIVDLTAPPGEPTRPPGSRAGYTKTSLHIDGHRAARGQGSFDAVAAAGACPECPTGLAAGDGHKVAAYGGIRRLGGQPPGMRSPENGHRPGRVLVRLLEGPPTGDRSRASLAGRVIACRQRPSSGEGTAAGVVDWFEGVPRRVSSHDRSPHTIDRVPAELVGLRS
jgi:hypothetical protein